MLRICMLGQFRVLRDGRELEPGTWKLQKSVAVFKYLVSEEGRWVPADVLLDLFWPDADPVRARSSLRTAVYSLRHALEPELRRYGSSAYIDVLAGRYRFRTESPHWYDVRAFSDAAAEARKALDAKRDGEAIERFDRALALYGGDFLVEDRYDEWTALPRERLRQEYLSTVMELAWTARTRPDAWSRVIGRLRDAVARAPEREDVQRELIWYLGRTGNTAEALRQSEALARMLHEEFGVEPAPETRRLCEAIRLGQPLPEVPVNSFTVRQRAADGAGSRIQRLPSPGAFVADWATFRSIAELERRRLQRWAVPVTALLLELATAPPLDAHRWTHLEDFIQRTAGARAGGGVEPWQQAIAAALRQGDVVCPVDARRLLVLLPHTDTETARGVARRLSELASRAGGNVRGDQAGVPLLFRLMPLDASLTRV